MRRRSVLQGLAALASGNAWPGFASGAGRAVDGTGLKPVGLRCEYAVNPLGVEASAPRLSWRLESTARAQAQSAYQILVASSAKKLADSVADLWDSGRIPSTESVHIAYRGQSLRSFERCYWKVKVWDKGGTASAYSEAARWEMGIMEAREWQAQWIGTAEPGEQSSGQAAGDGDAGAPLFRKTFHLRELPQRARACICGLGYYELYLNGAKVGDHVLDAAQTDYAERAFYAVYDITGALERGANAAGVMLGSGWFNQDEVWKTGKYAVPGGTNYGEPTVPGAVPVRIRRRERRDNRQRRIVENRRGSDCAQQRLCGGGLRRAPGDSGLVRRELRRRSVETGAPPGSAGASPRSAELAARPADSDASGGGSRGT